MNINIKATNIELTDAIREYVEKRLEGLDTLLSNSQEELMIQVEVGKTTNHHKSGEDVYMAEVNMRTEGKLLRSRAETGDLYAAIDKVRDQAFDTAKKLKSRERSFIRKGGQQVKTFIKKFFK